MLEQSPVQWYELALGVGAFLGLFAVPGVAVFWYLRLFDQPQGDD